MGSQLPIKLVLISNVVPNLNDGSGALSGRFVKLRFNHSFFDNEDTALRDKLDAELPGIAARCVAAYQRLRRRGRLRDFPSDNCPFPRASYVRLNNARRMSAFIA
jgi:phage/plasmid-associated DNA primase